MSAKKGKGIGRAKPKIVCIFRDGDGFNLKVVEKSSAETEQVNNGSLVVQCSETDWQELIIFIKAHAGQEG